jgi:hypothetical protein
VDLPGELIIRGRSFSAEDLQLITEVVQEFWDKGRTRISEEVASLLGWRQPNGWLKDRACRAVLRHLEAEGYLSLPPSQSSSRSTPYSNWVPREARTTESSEITVLQGQLSLAPAKGGSSERRWNRLVAEYHYLGFKVAVGRCLKFLVKDEGQVLGAVALSEASWSVQVRDRFLKKLAINRDEVANNSRFLILPGVRVPNLASRVLSLLACDGVAAWKDYYQRDLLLLETFVDATRFAGTSYRAANWLNVGSTKGFMKSGSAHRNSQNSKMIFLYPLKWHHRQLLWREITSDAKGGTASEVKK